MGASLRPARKEKERPRVHSQGPFFGLALQGNERNIQTETGSDQQYACHIGVLRIELDSPGI